MLYFIPKFFTLIFEQDAFLVHFKYLIIIISSLFHKN